MKNKQLILFSSIGFISVLLILAFGKIDYNLSNTIINKHSIWAEFFNMFGELPMSLGLITFIVVMYGGHKRKSKGLSLLFTVVSYAFLLPLIFLMVFMPFRYAFEFSENGVPRNYMLIIYPITILVYIVIIVLLHKIDHETFRKYRLAALVTFTLIFIEIIFVNVLKIVWARPRMRSIDTFEQFKYWWEINGPLNSEEFKSFPSGHTANAFVVLSLLSYIDDTNSKLRRNVAIFAFLWGIFTAISRVVLGAHFLSDVVFSGYITVILYFLIDNIINKNSRKMKEVLYEGSKWDVLFYYIRKKQRKLDMGRGGGGGDCVSDNDVKE